MQLTIINSNSSGNAYVLHNAKEALLLECGVHYDSIKRALNYNLAKVVGCLVTHEHNDHCKSVKELMRVGVNVYSAYETHCAMGTEGHHRARYLHATKAFSIGGFRIMPFEVKHDAAMPLGFLISHEETGNVLFLTDTYYTEYYFRDLNNVIIEANYCEQILDKRMAAADAPKFLRDRVIESHMSLQNCKQTLMANDLSQVNNIVLIHLSDGNSDAKRFKQEVEEVTGKVVTIADAGLTIDFNKQAF